MRFTIRVGLVIVSCVCSLFLCSCGNSGEVFPEPVLPIPEQGTSNTQNVQDHDAPAENKVQPVVGETSKVEASVPPEDGDTVIGPAEDLDNDDDICVGDEDLSSAEAIPLPDAQSLTPATPLLYDFVNGCLDWHVPINRSEVYSEFYIMRNRYAPSWLYTVLYDSQNDYTLPPVGQEIIRMGILPEQVEALEEAVTKLPSERVLREGDWELLLLELSSEDGTTGFNSEGKWAGFSTRSFGVLQSHSDGDTLPFLKDGSGWPTEWLRREPYCSLLLERQGLNMVNHWWDNWSYLGTYEMIPYGEESERDFTAILTCIDVALFHYDDGSAFTNQYLTWEDVQKLCDTELAYVPDRYTPFVQSIDAP